MICDNELLLKKTIHLDKAVESAYNFFGKVIFPCYLLHEEQVIYGKRPAALNAGHFEERPAVL